VLEDIKHQNEGILFPRLEVLVERALVDEPSVRISRTDQFSRRFDAFYFSELRQAVEKQAIPAPDVQNLFPAVWRLKSAKCFNNQFGTRSPPPVFLVKLSIGLAVLYVHKGVPENKTGYIAFA
jgi:hypothetical protein